MLIITIPTLFEKGEKNITIADKLEHDIAGAKGVTISGTHHMPNMEKPEEFNRIVLDFLRAL